MRSKLFVPGSREELFTKAIESAADAVSFDVEDSVVEDAKPRARAQVAAFLDSPALPRSGKVVVVRINALDSQHFAEDMRILARPGVALINLPKISHPDEVRHAAAALAEAERRNQVTTTIRLLVNIESATALARASGIAAADPRVMGLQLGLTDMYLPLGIDRGEPANVHATMHALRMACAAADVFAYDSAFLDVDDEAGFRREAHQARRLGFLGKSCIHPRQIPAANEIFGQGGMEVSTAQRIVAAARHATAEGRGAFVLDGRMIDLPVIQRAEAVLARGAKS